MNKPSIAIIAVAEFNEAGPQLRIFFKQFFCTSYEEVPLIEDQKD